MTNGHEFTLSREHQYHHRGDTHKTDVLTLRAPAPRDKKQVFRMRKHFFAAFTSMTKNVGDAARAAREKAKDDGKPEADLKGPEILGALYMSDCDMEKVHDDFLKLLLCDGVCKFGDAPLTKELYDEIDGNDVDNLLGEYFAVFFVASWMDGLSDAVK